MPKSLLTQKIVDQTNCPSDKTKLILIDTECRKLFCQVRPNRKDYFVEFIDKRGKRRSKKIGDVRDITLSQARKLAANFINQIAMGEDPLAKKENLKAVPKFSSFIDEAYLPFIHTYKRSASTDRCLIKNHLMPAFGTMYLDEITKKDVIQLIHKHRATHKPGSTNRIIILLRYIFNCAIRWETAGVAKNPTSGIPLLEENNKSERYLSREEAERLLEAVKQSENKMLQYIVPALLLTGARRGEMLNARWEDFNFEQRLWRIPTSKSGKARFVPMSDGLVQLLDQVPKFDDCPWVFPNTATMKPYVSIYHTWNKARISAGLPDVKCHSLRHSMASFLINNGRSLYEVQRILGHTQQRTTQRYAHLSKESLISAANEITKAVPILAAMPKQVIDVPLVQISS